VHTTAEGHWIGKLKAKRAWYVGNWSKVDTKVSRPMSDCSPIRFDDLLIFYQSIRSANSKAVETAKRRGNLSSEARIG